jgi:hypothetical protein
LLLLFLFSLISYLSLCYSALWGLSNVLLDSSTLYFLFENLPFRKWELHRRAPEISPH